MRLINYSLNVDFSLLLVTKGRWYKFDVKNRSSNLYFHDFTSLLKLVILRVKEAVLGGGGLGIFLLLKKKELSGYICYIST